jgi:hypothetical protein
MTAAAMRFSGGKDSTLAALRMAEQCGRIDLLTFRTSMIAHSEASCVNAKKLAEMLAPKTLITHQILDIEPTVRYLFQPRGWWDDWRRYGSYAACCMCNACDFSMFVHVILHCARSGIPLAFCGGSHTEFAGFLDTWGLPRIKTFAAEFGVSWEFPIYDEDRPDLSMLEIGLKAEPPQVFYRSQPHCEGGGIATNLYMRCYYLPRYGPDGYREMTLRWLDDRMALASEFIRSHMAE